MKTLLIDNHDSFTYNLYHLLAEVNGSEPLVVGNDSATWQQLSRLDFDSIVISPGPGSPDRGSDFGCCAEVIRNATVPLLGVCLGHQGLCWVHGAQILPAPEAVHGRIDLVRHDGSELFCGIPSEFEAVRYHSLCVGQPLPAELEPLAHSSDGALMAVAHRRLPQWGVQFHPESICTEFGLQLLGNFAAIARKHGRVREPVSGPAFAAGARPAQPPAGRGPRKAALLVRRLERLHDAESAFVGLYADSETAFWLDSSTQDERSRFSFMGSADGPLARVIHYDVNTCKLSVAGPDGNAMMSESIFDHLSDQMDRMRFDAAELPFDFNCGFVGYFGYELKAECGGDAVHCSTMPDASFIMADRLIAFDHVERRTYLLCLAEPSCAQAAERWIAQTAHRLDQLLSKGPPPRADSAEGASAEFRLGRSQQQYLDDIAACKQLLRAGESYEICLTNQIELPTPVEPLALYRRLRAVNPAPFAAYLRFGDRVLISSSPERFLRIGRDRQVEAKPIKGTCARGRTAAEDARLAEDLRSGEKSRAENLMICDVLRNDLGRVCDLGSVHVASLMHIETSETVHQLVSTIRGRLRDGVPPAECIRACFPGGSMTGAPKLRAMAIIDELEGRARGPYAGAIGYMGLSGGCDLSIVIRTIVVDGPSAQLGVGGAIVMQSDPEQEYQETLLKARAPVAAVDPDVDLQLALAQCV